MDLAEYLKTELSKKDLANLSDEDFRKYCEIQDLALEKKLLESKQRDDASRNFDCFLIEFKTKYGKESMD